MKNTIIYSIGILAVCLLSASSLKAQEANVTITNLRSNKGKIILQVFKDNESYDDEHPFKRLEFDKKNSANGAMDIHITLAPGAYGFTLIDDENGNGKIDKNIIGMPKEGFGFSNFFMTRLSKPAFKDFRFDIKAPNTKVSIKVKYM